MFKKELGISVYPEKFSQKETFDYIELAAKYGFRKIFLSLLQLSTREIYLKHEKEYVETIKFAKQHSFYVMLDIADVALEATNSTSDDLSYFESIGADAVRLDSPLMPKKVSDATHNSNLDIQINMSNNDHFIDNIMDFVPVKEMLFGSHNFFPQVNSAMDWDFFVESTKRFTNKGLHTTAFIGTGVGTVGPQLNAVGPLVSLELTRNKPIKTQAKILWGSDLISDVIIGNQPASESELKNLSLINKKQIEFDIELEKISSLENKILFDFNHFWRGDITKWFVRSTMTRAVLKNEPAIKPNSNENKIYEKGDIVIINSNDPNYQKELIVIRENNFTNLFNKGNLVGKIKDYDIDLLDLLKPWSHFKFNVVSAK